MDYPWHPSDGSEAQNIIRAAEAPPDSPFRPRFRRRSGEIVVPPGTTGDSSGAGTIAPPRSSNASSIRLGVLLAKQPVAEALARHLTLRDVFKIGSSCRELMNRLLVVGGNGGVHHNNGEVVTCGAGAEACSDSRGAGEPKP